MPCFMTDDQKENHVNISQERLAQASVGENFLKNITGYKTWVYDYDVNTKAQSWQWMRKGSPWHKKAHTTWLQHEGFFY